ncbi:hypothetical protein AALP_AAs68689U000100, partial [Arabis alpina]
MRLSVVKLDGFSLGTTLNLFLYVAVMNSTTLKDLIKKKVNEIEQANMVHRHFFLKHVWSNFCLSCDTVMLLDDEAVLQDVEIRNNSQKKLELFREEFDKTKGEKNKFNVILKERNLPLSLLTDNKKVQACGSMVTEEQPHAMLIPMEWCFEWI